MKKEKIDLAKIFLIISLFFGIIFIFVVPSFQSPDESAHFMKAYMLSENDFFPDKSGDNIGYCIPNSINAYAAEKDSYMGNLEKKETYSNIYYDQMLSSKYDECTFRSIAAQNTTNMAHIVPALGIKLTKIIDVGGLKKDENPSVKIQFARFACLLVYSLICYFAIKKTPKFKKSMFAILLLPNALLLRTMVSYDGLLMSVVALSLALMLDLIYNEKKEFTKCHMLWFIVAGYILLNVKVIYSLIFILMFAIPSENFGGKKGKIIKYIEMIVIVLVAYFLNRYLRSGYEVPTQDIILKQFNFIKSNPFKTFGILTNNIINQFKSQMYWMYGTYGLLDTYMPQLFVFILMIWTYATIIFDIFSEGRKIKILYKIILGVLVVLAVYAMYGIMYLSWTPKITGIVGGNDITGIQGRYYLPLFLMIPVIFSNNLISKIKNNKIKGLIESVNNFFEEYTHIFTTLMLTLSLIFIILRFYA